MNNPNQIPHEKFQSEWSEADSLKVQIRELIHMYRVNMSSDGKLNKKEVINDLIDILKGNNNY